MSLQECGLNLTRDLKELQPHGTLEFPCAGYSEVYTDKQQDIIPWHWHEELEIAYVQEGCLEVRIPSKTVVVHAGDLFVINSNVLHTASAVPECTLHSLVFHPALVWGSETSVFAKKYIRPLVECAAFNGCLILRREHGDRIQSFCTAFQAMEEEPPGYEFIVRENLSAIMLFLVQLFSEQLDREDADQNQNSLRVRAMLEYIHSHYAENITLSDIAKEAGIGERECLRCFQRTIRVSPIQYLLKYRITKGAEKLSAAGEASISEISFSCGFSSPSNFTRLFKRFYGCTPREYRKTVVGYKEGLHADGPVR